MYVKNTLTAPVLLFVIYILYLGSGYVDAGLLGSDDGLYLSVIILQLVIFILPGIFYCRVKGEGYSMRLNLKPIAPRKLIFIITSFLVMLFGTILIRLAHFNTVGYTSRYSLYDSTLRVGVMWDDPVFWYLVVAYAVIPAFCEEFVFRSVIIREYTDSCGELVAVIISTLTYAMLPLSFGTFFEQLFCGFILSGVTVITRSAVSAMLMRFVFCVVGIMGESTLISIFEQSDGGALVAFTAITVMLISMVFAFSEGERLCRFYAYTDAEPPGSVRSGPVRSGPVRSGSAEGRISFGTGLASAVFSPSFIACAAVFVIASIV